MTEFDASNLKEYKVAYLVMLIVIVVIIIYIRNCRMSELTGNGTRKKGDGNAENYYYGRGSPQDSVSELLDRIDWSTYLEYRLSILQRLFIPIVISVLFIMVFVMNKVPTPGKTILLFLSIFVPAYATHQLYYIHGDVYNDYYIKRNVELIREKLGLKKGKVEKPRDDNIPDRVNVSTP